MKKFFCILCIYSCFISFPILTMSGTLSRQISKKADKQPLLEDFDNDNEVWASSSTDNNPEALPPSYIASSALQFFPVAPQVPPQQSIQQTPLPAPAQQQSYAMEQGVPIAAYSTASAFTQTLPATTETVFEPPQGTAQTTSGIPQLRFLRGLMDQPPAAQRSSFSRTNSFNPFDTNPFVPAPATINVVGSATSSNSSYSATSATSSASSAPPLTQSSVAIAQKTTADHTQFVPPAEVAKPSEVQADTKQEQARQELLILMRVFYVRPDDSESRSNIEKRLIEKLKILKKQFPDMKNVNEWFLNLPIDKHGNTLAHWAATNGDHRLLESLRRLGVDMFRANFEGETPEQRVHKAFIHYGPLSQEEKRRFLNEPESESEEKKRVRKKSASALTQAPVDEIKKIQKYNAEQRDITEEKEQKWFKRFNRTKEFFMALRAKQEKK